MFESLLLISSMFVIAAAGFAVGGVLVKVARFVEGFINA